MKAIKVLNQFYQKLFLIIIPLLLLLFVFSCGKSNNNEKPLSLEKRNLDKKNLDNIKDSLFANEFIDALKLLNNNSIMIIYREQDSTELDYLLNGGLGAIQLFYKFPDLQNINAKINKSWGYSDFNIDKKIIKQFYSINFNDFNDEKWDELLNKLKTSDRCSIFKHTYAKLNFKDNKSKDKYYGITEEMLSKKYIIKILKNEAIGFSFKKIILTNDNRNLKIIIKGTKEYLEDPNNQEDNIMCANTVASYNLLEIFYKLPMIEYVDMTIPAGKIKKLYVKIDRETIENHYSLELRELSKSKWKELNNDMNFVKKYTEFSHIYANLINS